MNTNVDYKTFMQTISDLDAIGPEVEFEDEFTTEDYWNSERTDVVGYIRYWDGGGQTEYVLTGRF